MCRIVITELLMACMLTHILLDLHVQSFLLLWQVGVVGLLLRLLVRVRCFAVLLVLDVLLNELPRVLDVVEEVLAVAIAVFMFIIIDYVSLSGLVV